MSRMREWHIRRMKRLVQGLILSVALLGWVPAYADIKTIVLVHGAFADGSGWKPVADILASRGYSVHVVQEPLTSFAADLDADPPCPQSALSSILVGHSYAGMIMTELGMHSDVKALVYVAVFQPDVGEQLLGGSLSNKMPAATKAVAPVSDGFSGGQGERLPAGFRPGCRQPRGTLHGDIASPDRRGVIQRQDHGCSLERKTELRRDSPNRTGMINPDLERFMSKRAKSQTIELLGSHAIFISHAGEIATLIERAANAAK